MDFFRLSKIRRPGKDGQPSVSSTETSHLPQTSSWAERLLESSITQPKKGSLALAAPVLFLNCVTVS